MKKAMIIVTSCLLGLIAAVAVEFIYGMVGTMIIGFGAMTSNPILVFLGSNLVQAILAGLFTYLICKKRLNKLA